MVRIHPSLFAALPLICLAQVVPCAAAPADSLLAQIADYYSGSSAYSFRADVAIWEPGAVNPQAGRMAYYCWRSGQDSYLEYDDRKAQLFTSRYRLIIDHTRRYIFLDTVLAGIAQNFTPQELSAARPDSITLKTAGNGRVLSVFYKEGRYRRIDFSLRPGSPELEAVSLFPAESTPQDIRGSRIEIRFSAFSRDPRPKPEAQLQHYLARSGARWSLTPAYANYYFQNQMR